MITRVAGKFLAYADAKGAVFMCDTFAEAEKLERRFSLSKWYKELDIHQKINFKSHGYWRLWNSDGYMSTMIDNALSFEREDFACFTRHCVCQYRYYSQPKF